MEASDIGLEIRDTLAIVTLNRPRKLNALTRNHYSRLGSLLSEIAERKDITTTLLTGTGRFFSA